MRGVAGLLLIVPFLIELATVRTRGIDPDELEHLHAAFCVWRGMLPYRDFFEHHSPALYYLLQPAFWIFGPDLNTLWLGRAVMCVMSLATVAVTWRLARDLKGEIVAWTASLLLAWSSVFVLKGSELRPDVPACLCLTLMTWLAVRSCDSGRFLDWLGIGLVGGCATLCTQKGIVPVVSLAVSVVVARLLPGPGRRDGVAAWMPFFGIGLGGAVIWGFAAMTFASLGALHAMFAGTVLLLVRLPILSARWEHLRPAISADFTLWIAGGWYLAVVARDLARRHSEILSLIVMGTLAGSLLSLVWVKAIYPQYVLLWLPLLAVAAASGLDRIRETSHRGVTLTILGIGLLTCGLECKLLFDGVRGTQVSALSHLRHLWNQGHLPASSILVFPIGLLAGGLYLHKSTKYSRWVLFPLAILGMNYALARDVNSWLWSNRSQVVLVERVNSLVRMDETVLDGFAGYGALRPHANYFWWINRYSLALMSAADKAQLLEDFRDHPPAVVLYDRELRSWPEIRPLVEGTFWPTPEPPIWIRRKEVGGLRFPRAMLDEPKP